MSMERVNADLLPVANESAAAGPRLGFLAGMEAAYDASMRTQSLEGLTWAFEKLDDEQAQKAKKAGVEYTPLYARNMPRTQQDRAINTERGTPYGRNIYKDVARQIADGVETPIGDVLREHNQQIIKMNEANPSLGLRSVDDMFSEVRSKAQAAERRANLSHSVMGSVGSFVGDVAAGVDPRTNLLNTVTLPVGGAGKSVIARIATQAGGQAAIETVNQATGVQENRRLLGLDSGVGNALWNIAGAGLGGAALQGVGEAAVAGLRRLRAGRWFLPADNDPIPPSPAEPLRPQPVTSPEFEAAWGRLTPTESTPLSRSRFGAARADGDMAHAAEQLADWGGPRAWDVPPPTDTRLPGRTSADGFKFAGDVGVEPLDSIARRIDPDAFAAYDKLNAIKQDMRRQISDEDFKRSVEASKDVTDLRLQIRELQAKSQSATPRLAKKYSERIDALNADIEQRYSAATSGDSPAMAAFRQQLMHADEQLRDIGPTLGRAYARAQRRWDVLDAHKKQIDEMIDSGASGIGDMPASILTKDIPEPITPVTMHDLVPELKGEAAKPGETAAATVTRVAKETAKAVDEQVDAFRSTLAKVTDAEKVVSERERLDAALKAQEAKTAKAEGKDKAVEQAKLEELQAERNALDNFAVVVDGKEVQLAMESRLRIDDGAGGERELTVREYLRELDHDENMLKAVSTCSLNATS